MSQLNRRRFMQSMLAAGAGALAWARPARPGTDRMRVAVVGNGIGGQSFVHAMARLCAGARLTCIAPDVNTSSYGAVDYLQGRVVDMDFASKVVRATGGRAVSYDTLVLSPGAAIRWGVVDGYTPAAADLMPHGWIGNDRGASLQTRLVALQPGATVIIYVPDGTIRYPGGVERRIADVSRYLRDYRPGAKLLVLDARRGSVGERRGPDGVERVRLTPETDIVRVDADRGLLHSPAGSWRADLVNFIPPQQAGELVSRHGLVDSDGWCPVDSGTCRSLRAPDVYVLGDANTADAGVNSALSAGMQAIRCAEHFARLAQA